MVAMAIAVVIHYVYSFIASFAPQAPDTE